MMLDTSLFFALNNLTDQSYLLDLLIIFLAKYLPYLLIAGFLMAAYRVRSSRYIFLTPLIAAIIARFGITQLIRFLYHRPRPFTAYSMHQLISDNAWSFPSGHAAFFFALATGIYFSHKKWGVGFFLAAFFVTIARVVAGVHYPSDILAGMLIGIATAYLVRYCAERWRLFR